MISAALSSRFVHTTTFDMPNFSRGLSTSGLRVVVSAVLPGLMQNAFLLTLEVVVRAVIINDGVVPLTQFHAVLVDGSLNVIHLLRQK